NPSVHRDTDCPVDRSAVARSRDSSKSTLFRLDDEERTRKLPRLFLVLYLQRTRVPVSEYAVSQGLQHSSTCFVLALSSALAFSLERVSARSRKTPIQACGPCYAHANAGAVLDRLRNGLLHVLHHPGIL